MTEDANADGRQPAATTFNSRFLQVLVTVGILLGPATVIGMVCPLLNLSGRVTAEVAITVFLITTVLFFASSLEKRLHIAIPACVAVLLAAVLIHLLLTPKVIAEDPWVTWKFQIENEVKKCEKETSVQEICIAQAISQEYPKPQSDRSTDLLHNELHAGTILMAINPVRELLYKRIGVKDHFLGDGFAKPDDKEKPDALVPEYLAVNHVETDPDVWTWALAPIPEQLDWKVAEIIGSKKDTIFNDEISGRDISSFNKFSETVKKHLGYDRPAVIRFARFPPERYSHKMGLPDAKRVFVLHLGSVYNLSLGEAARLSGYSLKNAKTDHDKLWVWVYLPGDNRELVRPTWREIILNLKGWLVTE
jgi:hypothetical protein